MTEATRRRLAEMDIPVDDDQVILQRRVMPARSICRINGETVNVRILKELAGLLIDIHGQHDSQVLLQTKRHLEILDGYAGEQLSEVKAAYHKEWQKKNAIAKEILENSLDEAARKREISLAEFELEEIESAALLEKEDEELEKDYRRMVNGRRIVETLNLVHALTGYESSESAGEAAGRALRELSGIVSYDEELEEIYRQLSEVDGLLNDFNRTVSDYLSDIEFEEETFRAVEKRLDDINRLKDKYGRSISEVLLYAKRRQEELDRLKHQDEWLSGKRAELACAQERLTELAGKLTGIRKKAAKAFTADMQAALQDMNFLHVEFEVSLTGKEECGPDGMDDAVFLISTNPGEPVKPLASIASGGELSRIMLALKTITAKQETIGTFIFDEIDAGISGKTAWKVSQKLGILAKTHQIICITHLPQIAAMADHHFYIEKNAVGASTETTIEELSEDGSLKELARLSGAAELTPSVLANAKEMKELAEKNK